MNKVSLFILIALLMAGCGTPTTTVNVNSRPTTDPFIAVEQAERTAEAARSEADFYSRQLTATAEAPIIAITSTAAAFQMQQEFAHATQVSQMATETAAMTSTAMSWTPTANATATMVAIQIQAEGTMMANQLEMNNLKVARERQMNTAKAMSWYVVGLAFLFVALMFGIGQARKTSVFVVPSDDRGNPQPVLVDGIVMDIDRAPNGMMQASGSFLKQLPAITAERQDVVTGHDQMIDLKTRSAAIRRLEANMRKALPAPMDQQEQDVIDENMLNAPLPQWDLMRDWDGISDPLGFGKTGIITSRSSSLHALIAGKSGSGKTRFMLRTLTAADLARGNMVINLGGPASVGFGVFDNHPNYYTAPIREPRDIVACLQSVYEEMKERKQVIGGMDTDWEHWGSRPPRPFVTLLMDELGNMAEDLYFDDQAMNREMWSLIARLGNEGRKVGIRFLAALQDPTSKSMDLRFRRNCTLVSFQLGDRAHSNAFIGEVGAEQLTIGHFMARVDAVLFGGGFCPTDEEIITFLGNRHAPAAESSKWIDAVVTKQVEGRSDAALPSTTQDDSAEILRLAGEGMTSAQIVRKLYRVNGGGSFYTKRDHVDAVLLKNSTSSASSSQNGPVLATG